MKHIVCIIDGTWLNAANKQSFSNYSNPYAINWLLDDHCNNGYEQVVFYSSGLGATGLLQDYTAGAFAEGIDQQIRDAYINICSNFRTIQGKRDKIYIFGFSRGAVAARALSGMISDFGLLKPNQIKYYPKLWTAYTGRSMLELQLENAMIKDVDIEFLGLFDSVFGARNRASAFKSLRFQNFTLSSRVKAGVHILALDERRAAFSPMLFDAYNPVTQCLEQIWMPGVHGDIGGTSAHAFLGKCALDTMIDRIAAYTDLKFNASSLGVILNRQNLDIHVTNERVGLWRMSIPKLRKPQPTADAQYIHPLAYKIAQRLGTQYGKMRQSYAPPRPFTDAPFPTFVGFKNQIIW